MTPPKEVEKGVLSSFSPNSEGEREAAPARIVLVDDDDFFRESLGLNLVDEGYAVTSFSNGAAAIDYFGGGGEADVILLDWRMPGMNGLEVCRAVRQDPALADIPIILMTARAQSSDVAAGLDAGADAYIIKPFGPIELREHVEAVLAAARPRPAADR
jgi:two-component system response regulator ChvI